MQVGRALFCRILIEQIAHDQNVVVLCVRTHVRVCVHASVCESATSALGSRLRRTPGYWLVYRDVFSGLNRSGIHNCAWKEVMAM